uniref:Peptidase S1 domain-containing protein n=1 Tax=Panagrellus redivivus TaxID=6233 RepID=A0A7E4VQE8_PANRE
MLQLFTFSILLVSTFVLVSSADSAKCGQTPIPPKVDARVVGGQEAVPYSWPWQIVLCSHGWFGCDLECGGSVVGPNWVMTAGHCVYGSTDDVSSSYFRVKTGVFKQTKDNEAGEVVHKVKHVHLHPLYQEEPEVIYDIALIELADEVTYNNHTQPICLPLHDNTTIVNPNSAWATGWGAENELGFPTGTLRQVDVPFVNYTDCQADYPGEITPAVHVCAGTKGEDTCQGDSGGPLVVKNNGGAYFQYGITSFGTGCAEYKHPGVYSRVTAYCDWINSTTNGDVTCKDASTYA